MIISHKHKFIFIKTAKTAGTSLEIALSAICGKDDVISKILPEDEKIRQELGFRGAQNYQIPLMDCVWRDIPRLLHRRKRLIFFNHASAQHIKRHVKPEVWNDYYKFCFERNPWDKLIS
jgi:hypothetical protein